MADTSPQRVHPNSKRPVPNPGVFVKKMICQDPNTLGIQTTLSAVKPLEQCKYCAQGKLYGANYNAMAHLRRAHFHTKPVRGSKATKGDDKAAGKKQRGDLPPWSLLKDSWVVAIDQPSAPDVDVGNEDPKQHLTSPTLA